MWTRQAALVGLAISVLGACGEGTQTVQGECESAFGGDVCTWATLSGAELVEFGATVALATVEGAPLEGEMVFPPEQTAAIALPEEVKQATGFDHLGVNWERHGHPPALFMTPHFDCHVYTIPPAEVAAIDCSDTSKPADIPDQYVLPDIAVPGLGELIGLCVPKMGMHAMPASELEQTEPFGASMLVGYYAGDLIFLEPMISRAKLLERRDFPMTIPAVHAEGENVKWPRQFHASYDESAKAYRFAFFGFQSGA